MTGPSGYALETLWEDEERFYRDDALRTCSECGTLNPRPSRYEMAAGSEADIT